MSVCQYFTFVSHLIFHQIVDWIWSRIGRYIRSLTHQWLSECGWSQARFTHFIKVWILIVVVLIFCLIHLLLLSHCAIKSINAVSDMLKLLIVDLIFSILKLLLVCYICVFEVSKSIHLLLLHIILLLLVLSVFSFLLHSFFIINWGVIIKLLLIFDQIWMILLLFLNRHLLVLLFLLHR